LASENTKRQPNDESSNNSGNDKSSDPNDFNSSQTLGAAEVAALHNAHAEELLRYLIGLLRDPQLANDVLQMTFVKLVQRGGDTKEKSRKSWLFRVAHHEAMAIRRRDNTGDRIIKKNAWGKDFSTQSADAPLVRFEEIEAVREAIETLPVEQQEVVRMRIYDELKFAEIAEKLEIPLGTALGRMRAALAKLKQALEE